MKNRWLLFILALCLLTLPLTVWATINLHLEPGKKAAELSLVLPDQYKRPILLLDLLIDRPNSTVNIKSIKKGFGVVPDYKNPNALDFLEVEIQDKNNKQEQILVPLPLKEVFTPTEEEKSSLSYSKNELERFSFPVILPFEEDGSLTISKNFQKENQTIKSVNQIYLPKFADTQAKTFTEGKSRSLPLEDLSRETKGINYQMETVFDGNPSLTNPLDTLDIVFVSSGFSQSQSDLFRSFTKSQADALIGFANYPGKAPFSASKNIIKVRQLVSPLSFHQRNSDKTITALPDLAIRTLAALGIPFDQVVLVINETDRSYAALGGPWLVLFRSGGGAATALLFTHEFGHSFGALLDEYVESSGASAELGIHKRNCKEDPSQEWVGKQPGGAFLGCNSAWNLYRPEVESIMGGIIGRYDLEFNAPSKYLLEKALAAYTQSGLALLVFPDEIEISKDLSRPYWPISEYWIAFRNLGLQTFSFQGRLSPEVDWITKRQMAGIIPGYVKLQVHPERLNKKGKYSTNLLVDISTLTPATKRIPINILVGDSKNPASLAWISPASGSAITIGEKVPVVLRKSVQPPGWKRIEFYFKDQANAFGIFSSRTVAPFEGIWDTALFSHIPPGDYQLWAKGFPYFGPPVESNRVAVKIIKLLASPTPSIIPTPTPTPTK